MEVVEDFESRPHRRRSCRRCCLATVEGGCQEGAQKRKAEKKERWTRRAKKKGSGVKSQGEGKCNDGEKDDVRSPVEQSFMQSWDCLQTENEEEEESWRERDQMAVQWEEEQKLDEIVEQRRMEGDTL